MKKRLLIADDHPIILDGLVQILQCDPQVEIVGKALDGQQALEFLAKNEVDILCTDIEMPVLDGIEVAKTVKQKYPQVKVLVLSMYNRPEIVKQLADLGVDGFLKKDAGKTEYLLAIELLSSGDTYYSQHFTQSLIESKMTNEPDIHLTSRELEILNLLSEGLQTAAIADKLFISTHTVQSHRKNLLSKFQVGNTPTLIKKAAGMGLISFS